LELLKEGVVRLYEHEAKRIFQSKGIPIPEQYGVIHSPEQLAEVKVEYPVMLKAVVLIGGRGKAGGIKKASDPEEAKAKAEELFNLKIRGYPVESVLLERAVEEIGACYVGITMDPASYNNVVILSASGGVEIETVAKEKPEAIHRFEVVGNELELSKEISDDLAGKLSKDLGEQAGNKEQLSQILSKLYAVYQDVDAKVCEINPLILTPDGPIAADAKLVLDDNALFRQVKLLEQLGIAGKRHDVAELTSNEKRAQKAGFPYVDLLAEDAAKDPKKLYVGLVPGGAGYGIFSIDEVANIGDRFFQGKVVPVNFMDSGGGPSQGKVAEMFHLLMDYEKVDMIITSRFGGVSSCDTFIRGLIQALRERHEAGERVIPVYGRMVGTDLPSARAYLEKAKGSPADPALEKMTIIVGNQKIMADVIKKGISKAFESKGWN
jgi:succinyl-CoA synthetase beta subunit